MIEFHGSGFLLELPEACIDASVYTFLLPTPADGGFTPYMTIQSEKTDSDELESYVRDQHEAVQGSVENFTLLDFSAGQHQGHDVVLATTEWGTNAARIRQIQAHYLVLGEKQNLIYCLTGLDITSKFEQSRPIFNRAFKSFRPSGNSPFDESA